MSHSQKGFTLIDLIVSMAIFSVLTGAVIVNFRAGSRNDSVRRGAQIIASTLREAQTMTLSGTELSDGSFPTGGYGVRVSTDNTNALIVFADSDDSGTYTDATEDVRTVTLPQEVTFSIGSTLDVLFSAPDASIFFNGAISSDTEEITVQAVAADITQTVTIYRLSGQIRVE